MYHTTLCTIIALSCGLLAAGLQDCTNTADRFTRAPNDTVCDKAHIGSREVLVCTDVYRAR